MSPDDHSRSVLLAALVGSVGRHEKLADGDAARCVERALKRMERAVAVFDGRLLRSVGHELAALFDDPERACAAAREMQQRLAELPPEAALRLAIRAGVAHGDVAELAVRAGPGEEQTGLLGPTGSAAAHLAGAAESGQVWLSADARSRLSAVTQAATREVAAGVAVGALATTRVFALSVVAGDDLSGRFVVRYGDQRLPLDEPGLPLSIGRDATCALIINDRRASRLHAHIERRGAQVVLVDHSSNGTYVSLNGQPELFVRGGECILQGRGTICFAASASQPGADCAQFEEAP